MSQYPVPTGGIVDTQSSTSTASYPVPSGGEWALNAVNTVVTLSGNGVTASFGTLTAELETSLTGVSTTVAFGTLTPAVTEAMAGIEVSVALGDLTPLATLALTGNEVTVGFGAVTAVADVTLTGSAVSVSLGTLTPVGGGTEVALTGWELGVSFGIMRAPPVIYDMAWATTPTWLTRTLPSYLYIQYNDDEDLQAFVASQNQLQQELLNWFIAIGLPIYTGPLIVGALLDWVALGLYGQSRPTLASGVNKNLGPFNTLTYNSLAYNAMDTIESADFFATTDDVFKRIITWNFYKGDGRQFSVRWLKRRVMRFLLGENGTDPGIDQTYQVSVGFGLDGQVDIRILNGLRTVTGGAIFNGHGFNTTTFNGLTTSFVQYVPLEYAPIFKAAVEAGVLQLPFQFDWIVTV